MSVHHGKNGKAKIGSSLIVETTKWSLEETVDSADTTAQGDAARKHLTGIPGWSGSIDGNYDPSDATGQEALTIGASVVLGLYSDGDAAGKVYRTGTASITGITREVPVGGQVTVSFSFQGNGALTRSVV